MRDCANKLGTGIEARDAAIKIGGYGVTCLVLSEGQLQFPKEKVPIDRDIQEALAKLLTLEEGDVIIIGAGEDEITRASRL